MEAWCPIFKEPMLQKFTADWKNASWLTWKEVIKGPDWLRVNSSWASRFKPLYTRKTMQCLCLLIGLLQLALASSADETGSDSLQNQARFIPYFNVVRFPNDPCSGSSKNGTCYTAEECTNKGGTKDGSCAEGYGVCCVFSISCGSTSSENTTYLQGSITSLTSGSNCIYTICPSSSSICRIRLDFTTHVTYPPEQSSILTTGTIANSPKIGGAVGDCLTDAFIVQSPGNRGSPVICGYNTGQHMIVDASPSCNKIEFKFGAIKYSRSWDIKVTQFNCEENLGGPPDCLQYFTGISGTFSSFNFQAPVSDSSIHLSNQLYDICFRKESGYCYICFDVTTPTISTTAAIASFGLSTSPNLPAMSTNSVPSQASAACTTDYLVIPGGDTLANAAIVNSAATAAAYRLCGRVFTTSTAASQTNNSVCTKFLPFKMTFVTDSNEGQGAFSPVTNPLAFSTDENLGYPTGHVGFQLNYSQKKC